MAYFKHKIENLVVVDKIVTIYYFEFTRDYVFEGESHDFWEIVYADRGNLVCARDGEEITLKQGELIFYKPNEFHALRSDGVTAPNAFIMSFVTRSEAMRFFERRTMEVGAYTQLLRGLIREARATFDFSPTEPVSEKLKLSAAPALGGQQMVRTYLEQLLILLMRRETAGKETFLPPPAGELAARVTEYLKTRLDGSVTLTELCERFHYGKTYLCTEFKRAAGKTILSAFADMKIDEAKRLLREERLTVAQIAERLGYDTPAYFTTAFKKAVGCPPSQYLRSISD